LKILIIDDDQLHLSSLETSLTVRGYECKSFLNPLSAIEAYGSEVYDAVITTVKILEISGEEVLESILKVNSEAKVILITGVDMSLDKAGIRRGIYAYFRKPIMMDELIAVLEKIEKTQYSINERDYQSGGRLTNKRREN